MSELNAFTHRWLITRYHVRVCTIMDVWHDTSHQKFSTWGTWMSGHKTKDITACCGEDKLCNGIPPLPLHSVPQLQEMGLDCRLRICTSDHCRRLTASKNG